MQPETVFPAIFGAFAAMMFVFVIIRIFCFRRWAYSQPVAVVYTVVDQNPAATAGAPYYQQQQQPVYGQPVYGQPAYGQPAYAPYAQPAGGAPYAQYGSPVYGATPAQSQPQQQPLY